MTGERPKSPRARLFVALDLPEEMLAGIAAWGKRELADPALRPVARESLHITLAFLGYLPEKAIGRLGKIVSGLQSPAPIVELDDPVAKPSAGRPRVYALPARSSGLAPLRAELVEGLAGERLYEPEKRPFWPHVTVARVRSEGRGSKRPMGISKPPETLPSDLYRPRIAGRCVLYRSQLNPQGARHIPLVQVELSKTRRGGRDGR